jgi:hypothetical protein
MKRGEGAGSEGVFLEFASSLSESVLCTVLALNWKTTKQQKIVNHQRSHIESCYCFNFIDFETKVVPYFLKAILFTMLLVKVEDFRNLVAMLMED